MSAPPPAQLLIAIDLSLFIPQSRDRTAAARKALERKGARNTSDFRGVTHHLRTGRWEAHIWQDGKQVGEGRWVGACVCGGGGVALHCDCAWLFLGAGWHCRQGGHAALQLEGMGERFDFLSNLSKPCISTFHASGDTLRSGACPPPPIHIHPMLCRST